MLTDIRVIRSYTRRFDIKFCLLASARITECTIFRATKILLIGCGTAGVTQRLARQFPSGRCDELIWIKSEILGDPSTAFFVHFAVYGTARDTAPNMRFLDHSNDVAVHFFSPKGQIERANDMWE